MKKSKSKAGLNYRFAFLAIALIILLLPAIVFGQKQSNIWYFGPNGAGIDFNNICGPQALTNGWHDGAGLWEGTASMCDSNGHLLFYTDGVVAINANNDTMPSGGNLQGPEFNSVSQNIILPKPGSNTLYYIISPEIQGAGMQNKAYPSRASIVYSVVDMTLNGGLGDVISKRNILMDTATFRSCEKVTAVRHANGKDIWLLAHAYGSNKLLSFLITATGIDTVPIVSAVGPTIKKISNGFNAIGEIKASPNGQRLAFTSYQNGPTALFDFDKSTGIVSNPIALVTSDTVGGYGISFSPDNNKLYISMSIRFITTQVNYCLMQYDLSSGDSNTIKNSALSLYTATSAGGRLISLKIGPDQKIYAGRLTGTYLGVINFPDSIGAAAHFVFDGFSLNGLKPNWALSNAMELPTLPPLVMSAGIVTGASDIICNGSPVNLSVTGNTVKVQWQSSLSPSGFTNINGATSTSYTHVVTKNIFYRVYVSNGTCADTSNIYGVTVPPELNAFYTNTQDDLTVSFNSSLSTGNIVAYGWDFGDSTTSAEANPAHIFKKAGRYSVCLTVYDGSSCSYSYCGNVRVGLDGINNLAGYNKWTIYPDATGENFFISNIGLSDRIKDVEVYDMLGRLQVEKSVNREVTGTLKINVAGLPKGIYCFKVITAEGSFIQKIFIK